MGHTLLQKIISPITITIDSSIRDNTREVINIYNRALRNTIINTTLLQRIPIQNQQKPSIAEKWRKKAKNRTLNSIRLAFVKNTTMSNPAKRLKYIKCYNLNNPRSANSCNNFMKHNCNWSAVNINYTLHLS